ncbi:F510_1955 family glycosylhydrolase, partial [Agromyces binzhouensis]|uniref:F510_1955 family glycosylhydrolase n=1 Tax=Agromyces binzhouensis TaxID=1817495 RepID=UPI0013EC0D07
VLAACAPTSPPEPEPAPAAAFGHVHALGWDPVSDRTYAATHDGVWELPTGAMPEAYPGAGAGPAEPVQVGGNRQDTMGFTVARPGLLLASGHPGADDDHDLEAPNLGLMSSTDGARTWTPVSLRGAVDFHDLEAAELPGGGLRVYGLDSADGTVRVSDDGGATWAAAPPIAARDLAVDPGSPDRIYATTAEGLMRSDDAGATWSRVDGAPALVLVVATDAGDLVGIDVDGTVQRLRGDEWTAHGRASGAVEAMAVVGGDEQWLLLADARGIVASDDLGASVTVLVPGAT